MEQKGNMVCSSAAYVVTCLFGQCLTLAARGVPAETYGMEYPEFGDEIDGLLRCAEEHPALANALGMLTPEERAVVVLRCFGSRTDAEIAALLDQSVAGIQVLQHHAVAALSRLLSDSEGEERCHAT